MLRFAQHDMSPGCLRLSTSLRVDSFDFLRHVSNRLDSLGLAPLG